MAHSKLRSIRLGFHLITALVFLNVLYAPGEAFAQVGRMVRWIPSPSPNVVGYTIHVGSESGFFDRGTGVQIDVGKNFTIVDGIAQYPLDLVTDRTAFLVMTAVDDRNQRSAPSNEIFVEVLDNCSSDADCSDGNLCNGEEFCLNGSCAPRSPLECAASGPCQIASCDALLGCIAQDRPDQTACDDGDPLTSGDVCLMGSCQGTPMTEPGDPDPTPSPDPTPAESTIYSEDFDQTAVGDIPAGWVSTGQRNSLSPQPELFRVRAAESHAFGTTSTDVNIHSHYLAGAASDWSNYEYRGKLRISEPNGGIGVTLYSQYTDSDRYYRLRRYGGHQTFVLSPHGPSESACIGTRDTGVLPDPNVWYAFRFRAEPSNDGTRLRAKVWKASQPEPAEWQADCTDSSSSRLSKGAPGVWSMSDGEKLWDSLVFADLSAPPPPADVPTSPECTIDADCADGDLCNGTESCIEGACVAGTAPVCSSPSTCLDAVCDPARGCVAEPAPDGRSCDDGDACTVDDACAAGLCASSASRACPQPTQCQMGSCDAELGCLLEDLPDGSPCDDADSMTSGDTCMLGICAGTPNAPSDPEEPTGDSGETPGDAVVFTPVFFEDFESYAANADPVGWVDTGEHNSSTEDQSLFKTQLVDGNVALATTSTDVNIHSHYVLDGSDRWSSYEYSGRLRITRDKSGIGVTIHSQYPEQDRYQRLRRYGAHPTFHLASHGGGSCVGSTDTGVDPRIDTWYAFRLQAEVEATGVRYRAKVWEHATAEPEAWQVDCISALEDTVLQGRVGVWSMGGGTRYWDDLAATPLSEPEGSPQQ